MEVYILHHVTREYQDDEDVKLVDVYASGDDAKAAIVRLSNQPGFCDNLGGSQISPYELNKHHWIEGFVTEIEHVED